MTESFQNQESPKITRDQVIQAYKKFTDAGIGDPAELDLSDPQVIEANELYDNWSLQGDAEDTERGEVWRRHNFDKTMVLIDAGFNNKQYLEDALDWLLQDAHNAEKVADDKERTETRNMLAAAIEKVRKLLKE